MAPTPSGESLPSRSQQRPLGLLFEAPRKLGCSCQKPGHVLGLGPIHSGPRGKQLCLLGHRLKG